MDLVFRLSVYFSHDFSTKDRLVKGEFVNYVGEERIEHIR